MSEFAIRVANLSKLYHIGALHQRSDTLRDALTAPFRRKHNRTTTRAHGSSDELWALKDISFEVKRGEVVGIIGRNGAGKSTLLKILSRITEPTSGRAEIQGRVGSLLEVGTGFHPELTGRENIYMNGAILGMRRVEIDRSFAEIVAFAEIERFLDTPVKRYSSGMYVRLAFAVAAHLEPEILLVDEVLAVGDAAFQKKCLGKMGDVAETGRTVLFVSHNLAAIQVLCRSGVLLDHGQNVITGTINPVIAAYLDLLSRSSQQELAERQDRVGRGEIRIERIELIREKTIPASTLVTGDHVSLAIHVSGSLPGMSCWLKLFNKLGQQVATFNSIVRGPDDTHESQLTARFVLEIDELSLVAGSYYVNGAVVVNGEMQDYVEKALVFDVLEGQLRGRPVLGSSEVSVVLPHRWVLPEF